MNKTIELYGKEWKPIPGYEERYYVSADGDVLSIVKGEKKARILKQIQDRNGYLYVFMYRNGEMQKMRVHRAVLMAWDREPEDGEECRHLDDCPTNNRLQNLTWGSRADNIDDKRRNGGIPTGERSGSHKLTEAQVMDIRHRFAEGESSSELGKEFGVARNTILTIARGDKWKHLPIVPVKVEHTSKRKTPMSEQEKARGTDRLRMYAASIKKERKMIPCACGCGEMIVSVDSKGRDRKFAHGHNQRGKSWRWRKNA